MLKKLRNKKTAKKVWIVLAILIVPAFVLWGSGSLIRSRGEITYAGKIFGREISFLEFNDALSAVRIQMIMQFGDKFGEIQKYLNLESQAWERLILLAEAKKRKIKATDREVTELIEKYPFFQRKGNFNNTIYLEMLQYVFRTQARLFEEQTRQNLILSKLYKEVTKGVTLNDPEIKEAYRKNNEQVSVDYIAAIYADLAKGITPLEEENKDFFAKNSLQFKQPLSFNIEYITVPLENKNEKIIEDTIKNLISQLKKKQDLNKVAKDANLSAKETGLFGQTDPIAGIGWAPDVLNLISKARVGQILPPLRMDKNYYIIRLKEKKEAYIPDFEMVKDKVKEAVIKDKSQKLAKQKLGDCLEKLKEAYQTNPKSVDFERMAKDFGLKSAATDLLKYDGYIDGVGATENFWTAAGNLEEGKFSTIIEMPSGLYIIKLKSKVLVDEKKFESEKKEFSEKVLEQKKNEYFNKFLEELKKRVPFF